MERDVQQDLPFFADQYAWLAYEAASGIYRYTNVYAMHIMALESL